MVVMANRSVCFGWGAKSRDYDDERTGGWDQTELSFFFFSSFFLVQKGTRWHITGL